MTQPKAVTITPNRHSEPALARIQELSETLGIPAARAACILVMAAPQPLSVLISGKGKDHARK